MFRSRISKRVALTVLNLSLLLIAVGGMYKYIEKDIATMFGRPISKCVSLVILYLSLLLTAVGNMYK